MQAKSLPGGSITGLFGEREDVYFQHPPLCFWSLYERLYDEVFAVAESSIAQNQNNGLSFTIVRDVANCLSDSKRSHRHDFGTIPPGRRNSERYCDTVTW